MSDDGEEPGTYQCAEDEDVNVKYDQSFDKIIIEEEDSDEDHEYQVPIDFNNETSSGAPPLPRKIAASFDRKISQDVSKSRVSNNSTVAKGRNSQGTGSAGTVTSHQDERHHSIGKYNKDKIESFENLHKAVR